MNTFRSFSTLFLYSCCVFFLLLMEILIMENDTYFTHYSVSASIVRGHYQQRVQCEWLSHRLQCQGDGGV